MYHTDTAETRLGEDDISKWATKGNYQAAGPAGSGQTGCRRTEGSGQAKSRKQTLALANEPESQGTRSSAGPGGPDRRAASGIGRAVAIGLANGGDPVVLADLQPDAAQAVVNRATEGGNEATAVAGDVGKTTECAGRRRHRADCVRRLSCDGD